MIRIGQRDGIQQGPIMDTSLKRPKGQPDAEVSTNE